MQIHIARIKFSWMIDQSILVKQTKFSFGKKTKTKTKLEAAEVIDVSNNYH